MADLITLNDYKMYKGMVKTDQDDKINLLIKSVSSLIKAYLGHGVVDNWEDPIVEEYTLPYDSSLLYLNSYPIREIVSVEEEVGGYVGGLDSTVSYPVVFNTGFTVDGALGRITRIGGNWARKIKVTYTAGYEQTPEEIKLAAIELVSYYFNEEWKPTRTAGGTTMAGPIPLAGSIPKHVASLLDSYKVKY